MKTFNILLIAGHGDGDNGATGNGYKESYLTREAATLLKAELDDYANVTIADTNKNWYKHIIKKKNYFNFSKYDYVLEIHFNSYVLYSSNGTEIYVTTSEKSHGVESKIVKAISDIGFKNRGVKKKNFDLIWHIKKQGVSSALLEMCFISNANDMKLYQSKKCEVIKGIAKAIIEGFSLEKNVDDLKDACDLLAMKGIISSPEYWEKGENYSDANTVRLIKNFASYVKGEAK